MQTLSINESIKMKLLSMRDWSVKSGSVNLFKNHIKQNVQLNAAQNISHI